MRTHGTRWVTLQSIFAFTALLAVATVHGQQSINITAVNSVNNQIYSVNFAPPGSTQVLNTDEKSLYSVQSLVFVPNINPATFTFTFDLLAADNQKGRILRYAGDFSGSSPATTGIVVSTAITYPTGLSVDTAGDLFVVDNAPGHSPLPQVWVLQPDGAGGFGAQRLDNNTSFGKLQATVETLLAGTTIAGDPTHCTSVPRPLVCPGDLLVLTSNPAAVLLYPGNGRGTGPLTSTPPTTLISQCPSNPPAGNCIPIGTVPAGITVWPVDNNGQPRNSLLISTQSGSIQQYSFSNGSPTQSTFGPGLPSTLYKIKTGYQGGLPRAFVVQSSGNHGSILELGPKTVSNGPIQLLGTVTTGVAAPEGIAVTNAVQALASTCGQGNGCNLLGDQTHNVLTHLVKNLQGNIVEDVCVVPTDPRFLQPPNGKGLCNDTPLKVNDICAGFDNTHSGNPLVIPGYLCGGSGGGFALVKSLTTHAQNNVDNHGKPESEWNGAYVANSADSTQLLPGAEPLCGAGGNLAFAWAPLDGEGGIVEPGMMDLISGCGTAHSGTGISSLWAIGLALDTSAAELQQNPPQAPYTVPLWNFTQMKYTNLTTTVTNMTPTNITNGTASQELFNSNNNAPPYNLSAPSGCIDLSWSLFYQAAKIDANGSDQQKYDFTNAANLLTNAAPAVQLPNVVPQGDNTTCDSIVTNNLANFSESATPLVLNPSGQIRSRLANLYYTINALIRQQPTAGVWPPPITINVSPQTYVSGGTATLSWAQSGFDGSAGGLGSCAWSSNDPGFNLNPPSNPVSVNPTYNSATPTYYYTRSCQVTNGTMTPATNPIMVTAYLTVQPPPPPTLNPLYPPGVCDDPKKDDDNNGICQYQSTISWTNAAGCALTDNGMGSLLMGGLPLPAPLPANAANGSAVYSAVEGDGTKGSVTFTLACPNLSPIQKTLKVSD